MKFACAIYAQQRFLGVAAVDKAHFIESMCFVYIRYDRLFPTFSLEKKVGPKVQGKRERSARFALPARRNSQLFSVAFFN